MLAQTGAPLTCVSVYGSIVIRLIGWTAANHPHRNFTSPHTDGPPPLPATLLTLGLWLDGSIIVPVYASSPHKLPRSFCGLGGDRLFPWGSRGAPAVRLGIDRKYPICPMLRMISTLSLSKNKVCQPVKAHRQPMGFYRPATTRKARIGKVERGDTFPYGQGLGYLECKDFGNKLGFQSAAQFRVCTQMGIAVFVVKLPSGQRGNIPFVVFQHGIDRVDVAACRSRNDGKRQQIFTARTCFHHRLFPPYIF